MYVGTLQMIISHSPKKNVIMFNNESNKKLKYFPTHRNERITKEPQNVGGQEIKVDSDLYFKNAFHIQIPNFGVKYEHYTGGFAFKLFQRIVYSL